MEHNSRDPRFTELLALASAGDADAQFRAGQAFEHGEFDERDASQAFFWIRKAAEQGHLHAEVKLSDYFDSGFGTAQNPDAAYDWAEKAALAGFAPACKRLPGFLATGRGTERDLPKAAYWEKQYLLLEAAAGEAWARYHLGNFFRDGRRGHPRDRGQALKWYLEAAAAGHKDAMLQAAAALERGDGCDRDEAGAAGLCDRALGPGSKQAERLRKLAAIRPAAARGDAGAMAELGRLLGPENPEGLAMLKSAAGKDSLAALEALFDFFRPGSGENSLSSEAAEWINRAAKGGVAAAAEFVAARTPAPDARSEGDREDLMARLEKAAAAGDKVAAIALNSMKSSPMSAKSPPAAEAEFKGDFPSPAGHYELRVIGTWLTLAAGGSALSFKIPDIAGLAAGAARPAKGGGYAQLWLRLKSGGEKNLLMSEGCDPGVEAAYLELGRKLAASIKVEFLERPLQPESGPG